MNTPEGLSVKATLDFSYQNIGRPCLDVREIASLIGLSRSAVTEHGLRSRRSEIAVGERSNITCQTTGPALRLPGRSNFSGSLRTSFVGARLLALAVYADMAMPNFTYMGSSANKSLTIDLSYPNSMVIGDVEAAVEELKNPRDYERGLSVYCRQYADTRTLSLEYRGNIDDIANRHRGITDRILDAKESFGTNFALFDADQDTVTAVIQEARSGNLGSSPYDAANHIIRCLSH